MLFNYWFIFSLFFIRSDRVKYFLNIATVNEIYFGQITNKNVSFFIFQFVFQQIIITLFRVAMNNILLEFYSSNSISLVRPSWKFWFWFIFFMKLFYVVRCEIPRFFLSSAAYKRDFSLRSLPVRVPLWAGKELHPLWRRACCLHQAGAFWHLF